MKRIVIIVLLLILSVLFISCNNNTSEKTNDIIDNEQVKVALNNNLDSNTKDLNETTGQEDEDETGDATEQTNQNNGEENVENTETTQPIESTQPKNAEEIPIIEDKPLRVKDLVTKDGNFEYIDYYKKSGFHYYADQFFSSGLYGYPIGLMPSDYTMDIYTTKGLFYLPYEGNPTEFNDVKTDKLFRIDWYHNHTESYVTDHPYEYMEEYEDTYIVIIYKIDDVYYGYLILSVEHKIANQNENHTDRVVEGTFVEIYVEEVASKLFDLEYDDLKKITKSLLDIKILLEISDYSNNKD